MNKDEYTIKLLQSLSKPKYLDMGRSPVEAIQRVFEMEDEGLVTTDEDGWVHITVKGKELLGGSVAP